MCRACLSWFVILSIVFGMGGLVVTRAPAAPAAPDPWLQLDNAGKYIFLGKTVWDVDAGKLVSQTGAPDVFETTHRIAGVSDRVFDDPPSGPHPAGMVSSGRIVMLDGSPPQTPTLDGKQVDGTGYGPAFWINSDHRRVVWIQSGDYWRGEIDWTTVTIVNRKQVTSLGVFTPLTSPILWWGQLLFVDGEFDKAKPIVRIDLASGEVTEMETHRAFSASMKQGNTQSCLVSPGNARIVNPTSSVIYCYDVRTGNASMFRNKFEDNAAKRSQPLFLAGLPPIWTNDDTVYSLDAQGYLAKIDLRNSRMEILHEPPPAFYGEPATITRSLSVLHGTQLVDQSTSGGANHDMAQTSPGKRSLLDVTNQQQTPLPFDDSMSGKWIDDTKYIYVQTTGGLSTVGTWLYDRGDNSNKHLSSFSVDFSRMVMLPERKQIWAVSQQSGINLIRMNLDGSPSQNLGPCPLMIPQRMPPADDSVDLGFNGSGAADLWKPVAVDEAALAATQPAEPPEGKLKLFELTKDFSADDKTFVEQAYDYCQTNAMLSNYCDPTKVAMKVFQLHQSQPGQPVTNFYVSTDFSDTADHDHLVRYGHDHALALIAMDQKLTADQKRQIADRTGSLLADAYFKEAKPNLRNIDSLCQTAMANARQGVESGASPAAEQTTSPPIQQQQQQQQQMQQTQQQPASHIDQAASEAKKAKDAANRLKGLFGHN